MRYLIVSVLLLSFFVATVNAQTTAQEKAANLRAQIAEVEAKQLELQTRLKDLDEQLKPENIESALAGIGSLKPEDLRAQRRRQLEIQRNGVQSQLNLLTTSHTRLETSIAQADAEAYKESAAPAPVLPPASTTPDTVEPATPTTAPVRARRVRRKKSKKTRKAHHALIHTALQRGVSL